MYGRFKWWLTACCLLAVFPVCSAESARIKDIATIKGVRSNQLFGYGLVIGLDGSGDSGSTQSQYTVQAMANMLERMGIHVNPADIKVKNAAAVMVNATLPPFARIGKKIDVTVSSIGNAKSLQGGTLLMTPLMGVDREVYALAQGPLSVGGFSAGGKAGGGVTKNHPTAGRIADGATIERELPLSLAGRNELTLVLNHPDFVTAARLADTINDGFGRPLAQPLDSATVKIAVPPDYQNQVVRLMARMENLDVDTDTVAKVMVSEKTGTVVIGENVRIDTIAVAHGNLTIQIKEQSGVSQPAPFSPPGRGGAVETRSGVVVAPGGSTVVVPESDVSVDEQRGALMVVAPGQSIGELVRALNAIGMTPRDLITILQVIKAAGALQAELEII
jgi:flagellar P-ring protein precursor FlgI